MIIDGSFGGDLQAALVAALVAALEAVMAGYSWEGVARPVLLPSSIGSDARALGGALLPLHANFSPDRELFLKIAVV